MCVYNMLQPWWFDANVYIYIYIYMCIAHSAVNHKYMLQSMYPWRVLAPTNASSMCCSRSASMHCIVCMHVCVHVCMLYAYHIISMIMQGRFHSVVQLFFLARSFVQLSASRSYHDPSCAAMSSQQSRIDQVAPALRHMVHQHENDTFPEGVEAFNTEIMRMVVESGLVQQETRQLDNIGVHPDNREKGMLVPVDCHDLLLIFSENGYSPKLWDVLAARVPKGPEGDNWRQANVDLLNVSDGLLATQTKDNIEVCTGRGSHSCSALRLAKFGGRSVHPELAGPDGQVSKAKFLALQPSWTPLLQHGVTIQVMPGELELAVPGLLACLSRVGNASHDVYRQPTSLQMCSRIHSLYVVQNNASGAAGTVVDWKVLAKQAVSGYGGAKYLAKAEQLCKFVKCWSGGAKEATLLRELEHYERSITVKRKVFASDLEALSMVDLLHAPKYVAATCLD